MYGNLHVTRQPAGWGLKKSNVHFLKSLFGYAVPIVNLSGRSMLNIWIFHLVYMLGISEQYSVIYSILWLLHRFLPQVFLPTNCLLKCWDSAIFEQLNSTQRDFAVSPSLRRISLTTWWIFIKSEGLHLIVLVMTYHSASKTFSFKSFWSHIIKFFCIMIF